MHSIQERSATASSESGFQHNLFGAPSVLVSHGLPSLPARPRVSTGRLLGDAYQASTTAEGEFAWHFPEVEYVRDDYRHTSVPLDVDGVGAAERVRSICGDSLPAYNVAIESKRGGLHVVYFLKTPVGRVGKVSLKPINYLKRISEYYGSQLRADSSYGGVLAHNPVHEAFKTHWGRSQPFTLAELAEPIPKGWRVPKSPQTAMGRNVGLFQYCLRWAGSPSNLGRPVIEEAELVNGTYEHPLGQPELQHVAASVERYRRTWIQRGQFDSRGTEERRLWGQRLGKASGRVRRGKAAERDGLIVQLRSYGLKQAQIARQLHVHQSTVSRVLGRICVN